MRRLIPVLFLMALALAGCGPTVSETPDAIAARSREGRTFRLALAQGEKFHYTAVTEARSEVSDKEKIKVWPKEYHTPASMAADGIVDMVVTKVKDGMTTIQIDTKLTKATGKGWGERDAKEAMANKVPRQSVTYNAQLVNQKPDISINPVINSLHRLYPEKPVKLGGTWSYEPFPGAPEATVTYEADEEIAGEYCAKLSIQLPKARDGDKTLMELWCSHKTGWVMKFSLDMMSETDGLRTYNLFSQTVVRT